jgi:hypothetical protein
METTANFKAGFGQAYAELRAADQLSLQDGRAVGALLAHDLLTTPSGLRINGIRRSHRVVRRLYCHKHNLPLRSAVLDWTSLVDWIKENWVEIVRFILALLPFLLMLI